MKFIKITLCAIFFLACNKSFTVEYGTEEEAEMMLNRAVNLMKFDEMYALEQMTEGGGGFIIKDLYPFCANSKGILVGHPVNVGFNVLDFVDSDGKNVGEEFFKIAEKNDEEGTRMFEKLGKEFDEKYRNYKAFNS